METIIPAVFDNRHEKRKWTIIPVILLSVFFVGIFLPIMIFIRLNSAEIMVAFILTVMACMTMYLWYHLMVPSFVILDHHFLILERKVRKEMIQRISNGVLFLKMADGKQIIRSGIDNMILYHLTNYIGIRNINCV
jgi:hypothetical protein